MSIRRFYLQEYELIRTAYRPWLLAAGVILLAVIAASYAYLAVFPGEIETILEFAAASLPAIGDEAEIVGVVLARNLLATAIITFSGGLTFGVIPLINLVVNGFVIGSLLQILSVRLGVNPLQVALVGILPHGLLELPAVILAGALGLRLGILGLLWLTRRRPVQPVRLLRETLQTWGLVVVPALVLAALIEGTVTVWLVQRFLTPGA